MTAQQPPPKRGALYSLGARDVHADSLKLLSELKVMLARGYKETVIARALEVTLLRAINAERQELATLARELEVSTNHLEIRVASSRGSSEGVARATVNVCRSAFARLCVERISSW